MSTKGSKRKHTNTKGRRQVKTGAHLKPLYRIAQKLGVQVVTGKPAKKDGL